MFQSGLAITSLIISICTFVVALGVQLYYFFGNKRKLAIVRNFFNKNREYAVWGEDENSQIDATVADSNSHLFSLITELNKYTRKNHGTTIIGKTKSAILKNEKYNFREFSNPRNFAV